VSQEETNLAAHVEICAIRFKGIEQKMDSLERRLDKVEDTLSSLKTQSETGFNEIKVLIERNNANRQIQVIATFGTIITAILAFVGYLVTH